MENKSFLNSLRIALFGIKSAFEKERNFRTMLLMAVIVIILMIALGLNPIEESILLLTILAVLSLELINSQIEKFLDLIQPTLQPRVKIIKDLSAGAVLFSALGSIFIGILIFLPHIINFIERK